MINFQARVDKWMLDTFGEEVSNDRRERSFRFGEEAIELLQAAGLSKVDVLKIIRRVFSRPAGRVPQEIGGTMVTLAAFCAAHAWDMDYLAQLEQTRCEGPDVQAKILAKQQGKRAEFAVPLIDHEALLLKYMQHVVDCDGWTYTYDLPEAVVAQHTVAFDASEIAELQRIAATTQT